MYDRNDCHQQCPDNACKWLQIPAYNLPVLFTAVVSLSVGHNPLLGRKQSVATCRVQIHHLFLPRFPIRNPTFQLAYKDFCPRLPCAQQKFNPAFVFAHSLIGICDPGNARFELLWRRRLCFTFGMPVHMRNNHLTDHLAGLVSP